MSTRRAMALAAAVGLWVAGCSTPEASPPANLLGSHSLVLVGDLLFVTSSERNELRALDLRFTIPRWVRAPNPLEALSIPVLDRPISLACDVSYEDKDAGQYVYATSSGTAAISIVASAEGDLVEVARLVTAGPVTAIAARVPARVPGVAGKSTLFYAVATPGGSDLYQLELASPDELKTTATGSPPTVAGLVPRYLTSLLPGELVSSIVVLSGQQLAISTRAKTGSAGRTLLVDPASLPSFQLLNFPSRVRALFTHAPGTRVFGFLDEEACGAAGGCSGVVAVDVTTRNVANDATGSPMLPIPVGGGLARGLAFAPEQEIIQLIAPGKDPVRAVLNRTGILTSSTGDITLFDAEGLRAIDTAATINKEGQVVALPATRDAALYQDVSGTPLPIAAGTGPQSPEPGAAGDTIALADGATRNEVVTLEYQALIPGLVGLPTNDLDGLTFKATPEALARAAVGDTIAIGTPANVDCGAALTVTAIVAEGLVVAGPIPPACAGRNSFSVIAGGAQPWVVTGTASGYMGRTAAGSSFAFQGSYFHHPDGFDPTRPQLAFKMGTEDPAVARGNRYSFQTFSNFNPLISTISFGPGSTQQCTSSLPGSVAFAIPQVPSSGGPEDKPRAYIAYPSANGVLELNLSGLGPGPTSNAECLQ